MRRLATGGTGFELRPLRARAAIGLCAVAVLLTTTGCATTRLVELQPKPQIPLADQFNLGAWGGPQPSERTMLVLRRYSLADKFSDRIQSKPDKLIATLTQVQHNEPSRETVYALAELNYIAGTQRQVSNAEEAVRHYLNCIRHCSTYLFDPAYDHTRNPYDPQFRGACDLYNGALENSLRITRSGGRFRPGGKVSFATVGSRLHVPVVPKGFRWQPEDFDSFEFVADYNLNGLDNRHRTHGLGVPLIAIRKGNSASPEIERHYARNLTFPVTAFLRLEGDDETNWKAHLELYDPLETTDVDVAGLRVPLESDITTPLAYLLDDLAPHRIDLVGLLRPDQLQEFAGLYMVQPYQPGKIPVLMVHGLWSSPMTWLEAFNDLQAMPDIRERYQFWFYLYPTGKPFWQTSADLREDLAEVRRVFDPDGREQSLDNMVLVGHSMGGLISRMMTVESENRFWNAVSETPFQTVRADTETKEQIERVFFFDSQRSVSRVITIGSPHRGSEFSNDYTRRMTRALVTLPQKTLQATTELVTMNPGLFRDADLVNQTSVDSLSPESPILKVLLETPKPEAVKYHNIVGIVKHGPLETNTDGVVPYWSAHLDDVESELVVRAHHSDVHRSPVTVREIRRILMQHLSEVEAAGSQVIPIGGSSP